MIQPMLSASDVVVRFGQTEVLHGVSASVHPGEVVALVGPNGAGKTTFFNAVSGFVKPSSGEVLVRGRDITGTRPNKLLAAGVARTFQEGNLFDTLTVRENLYGGSGISRLRDACGTFLGTRPGRSREGRALEISEQLAKELNINSLTSLRAGDISTGSRRLVDLGRALASDPSLLLLDEPAAGLSINNRAMLSRTVRSLVEGRDRSVLLVEHDLDFVSDSADRVIVMHLGVIIAEGSPAEVRRDEAVRAAYLGT